MQIQTELRPHSRRVGIAKARLPVVARPHDRNTAPAAHAFVPHRLLTPGERPLRALARATLTAFRPRGRAATSSQRGMTLIEIMVVVAIISLIMGGVGIMAFNRYQDAQKQDTKNQTITIQGAIEQYRTAKRGKCPKTLEDLKAAGFISRVAKDAWGNDFTFKCPGEKSSIDVMSPGEDGELGTADDITNYGEAEADGEGEEDK